MLIPVCAAMGEFTQKSLKAQKTCGSWLISLQRREKDAYKQFCLFPDHALLMWWELITYGSWFTVQV